MNSLPLDKYLKFYQEQKRLEEYQQTRTLSRPNVTKSAIVLLATGFLAIVFGGVSGFLALSPLQPWVNVPVIALYLLAVTELYGRWFGIKVVQCYQHYAKEETRRSCKCIPSCSEYAILCFRKHEFFHALRKIRKRLFVTCKGFDYIVDKP